MFTIEQLSRPAGTRLPLRVALSLRPAPRRYVDCPRCGSSKAIVTFVRVTTQCSFCPACRYLWDTLLQGQKRAASRKGRRRSAGERAGKDRAEEMVGRDFRRFRRIVGKDRVHTAARLVELDERRFARPRLPNPPVMTTRDSASRSSASMLWCQSHDGPGRIPRPGDLGVGRTLCVPCAHLGLDDPTELVPPQAGGVGDAFAAQRRAGRLRERFLPVGMELGKEIVDEVIAGRWSRHMDQARATLASAMFSIEQGRRGVVAKLDVVQLRVEPARGQQFLVRAALGQLIVLRRRRSRPRGGSSRDDAR